jgi:hypothetical protein
VTEPHASNDPRYWLERAGRARHVAEGMTDPELKRMMLGVADGYERLAKRADERTQRRFRVLDIGNPPSPGSEPSGSRQSPSRLALITRALLCHSLTLIRERAGIRKQSAAK